MRISDWSSDVCFSDLPDHQADRLDHDRPGDRVAAEKRGIFDPVDAVAIGEEHHVQLPALDQLRELDPAIDVESGIDHRIRMPPSPGVTTGRRHEYGQRSEEHTSELQSLMRNSYAVF